MSRGDLADRAGELQEEQLADALAEHNANVAAQAARDRALGDAPVRCMDCSITIPLGRRRAVPGCKRCTDCQQLIDLVRSRRT
jgi:RNA polymerase-binding transcription factor DksA